MKLRIAAVLATIAILAGLAAPAKAERLVDLVNPFVATGGVGFGVGSGYPGPAAPFGMIHPSPDTSKGDEMPSFYHCAGYYYPDTHIRMFSHTRIYAIGVSALSNIGMMPTLGAAADMVEEKNYRSEFSHKDEAAHPGYYSVLLKDTGIRAELTAGERVAHHRYTYPASDNALLVVNASHLTDGSESVDAEIKADAGAKELTGFIRFNGGMTGGGEEALKIYYVIQSKGDFTIAGTWKDGVFSEGEAAAHGKTAGAVLSFKTTEGEQFEYKVGISYISVDQARANLLSGEEGWDFGGLRKQTEDRWEKLLGRIEIDGGAPKHRKIFYTAMYHTMLAPTLMTEAGNKYVGLDKQVHEEDGFLYYSDLSLWDTFRTLHPLLILTAPEHQLDFVKSMLAMAEQGGHLPKWPARLNYSNAMVSSPADSVIADTYLKGLQDFDAEYAFAKMKENAMGPPATNSSNRESVEGYVKYGYIPNDLHGGSTVSDALEHAFHDYAIAQFAKALGKQEDYEYFLQESQNYRNLFNPETKFMDGRNSDGSFITPGDETAWREQYCEGNAWQWAWYAPQDVPGLIELFGGRAPFLEKLDFFFKQAHRQPDTFMPDKYYWHGNEIDIHAPYLFLWAGRPDRTQEEVRWIMLKKYDDTADGIDGNDDAGTMSSWFVFSSMGIFPIPATNKYFIGSPLFTEARVKMPGGDLVIKAPETSKKNLYVQSAKLNGKPLEHFWIEHNDIANGGVLEFEMGPEPGPWMREE